MPDGQIINVGEEFYQSMEGIFDPGRLNLNEKGLIAIIQDFLNSCSSELKEKLLNNIILEGEFTCVRGFKERLKLEIEALIKKDFPKKEICFLNKTDPEYKYLPFLGGSILMSIDFERRERLAIKRDLYEETGPTAIKKFKDIFRKELSKIENFEEYIQNHIKKLKISNKDLSGKLAKYEENEDISLIIDAGSIRTKAGFSGELLPHRVFPSVVGTFRYSLRGAYHNVNLSNKKKRPPFDKLIKSQTFEGYWQYLDSKALQIMGIKVDEFNEYIPEKMSKDIWLSIVILAYLQFKFSMKKVEWKLVAKKAKEWLKSQKLNQDLNSLKLIALELLKKVELRIEETKKKLKEEEVDESEKLKEKN
ncbi:actin-5c-related [Anaeramoeba flamelloides]|uniref:Actin-5c-related n=1 Tax=Anaeramoeba flamelloides TaxID=1746091 RepID=A0AAV7YMJ2_9EUKA|nr:actin-5c-related [Anaeramoeba flamelloides]